jgi:hypothetical protein
MHPDPAGVVGALSALDVQFVVVGDLSADGPLRVVVSRHPANLDALGRALGRMGAALSAPSAHPPGPGAGAGTQRVGDQLGTVAVAARGGDVEILFGGARGSLYAETLAVSEPLEIGTVLVRWTGTVPASTVVRPVTGRRMSDRLLSLAQAVADLIRREEEQADGGEGPPAGAGWNG